MFYLINSKHMILAKVAIINHPYHLEESASHPFPLLEGAPQVMVSGEKGRPLKANVFMARRCFKCNVLRILLSEFDEAQNGSKNWLQRAILYRHTKT